EKIEGTECLYAFASRTKSRLGKALRVVLRRPDHDAVLEDAEVIARREYRLALEEAVCERPFYRDPHQESGWRRNYKDPALTERAAGVLLQLAGVALVEFVAADVEDALLS